MSAHSLTNIDNYNQYTTESSSEIFSKYINTINDYLNQCHDNINIQNIKYFKYIINQGVKTISNVFLMIYLYTNNLSLTLFHCQKAIYYYIEFIGQIGDDNHSFLQLNSKDATLFVYKKTIFDIDNIYRKEFASPKIESSPLYNFEMLIAIYIDLHNMSLLNTELSSNKNELITVHKANLESIHRVLINLSFKGEKDFTNNLKLIQLFKTFLIKNNSYSIEHIEAFAKRLRKKSITEKLLQINLQNLQDKLYNNTNITSTKYANLAIPS